MALGFRIVSDVPRAPDALMDRFVQVPAAHLSDAMNRLFAGGSRLRPMHRGAKLVGNALTVRTRPGDNLMVHKAIDIAQPRDVIVVDAGGELAQAIIGEIMTTLASSRGIAGFVIDGAVRDSGALAAEDFPVYAAGVTHRGPYKDGPGEINVPIAIDGMVIEPGDLILGDADGFLCIPFADTEEVLAASQKKVALEQQTMKNLAAGTHDTSWVNERLRQIGCDPTPR
jgi:regulator of RNase E activity RraA